MIDITMTAMPRPEIVNATLRSFSVNAFGDYSECRLIINIDPFGNKNTKHVLDVVHDYFKHNNVIYRTPDHASFPDAFKWTWSQVTSPISFNLEDDWILLQKIKLKKVKKLFQHNNMLASLRLCNEKVTRTGKVGGKKNRILSWDEHKGIYIVQDKFKFGVLGHPSFFNRSFILKVLEFFDTNKNPEFQFRMGPASNIGQIMKHYTFGEYTYPGNTPVVEDIGRRWRNSQGIQWNSYLTKTRRDQSKDLTWVK